MCTRQVIEQKGQVLTTGFFVVMNTVERAHSCVLTTFKTRCQRTVSSSPLERQQAQAVPVSFFHPFQTGLRMHCLWTGLSAGPKLIRSTPPAGPAYHTGVFLQISCSGLCLEPEGHEPSFTSCHLKVRSLCGRA